MIKVTQNSKPQAVMADRLWTVHDVCGTSNLEIEREVRETG